MPKPRKSSTDNFVRAAIDSGGQMMLMITSMGQAIEASADPGSRNARIEVELLDILGRRLRDRPDPPPSENLEIAAEVVAWMTTWIGEEVFGAEPGREYGSWVPEVRGRVRRMRDNEFEKPGDDFGFPGEESFRETG